MREDAIFGRNRVRHPITRIGLSAAILLAFATARADESRAVGGTVGAGPGIATIENQSYFELNTTAMVRFGHPRAQFRADVWLPLRFRTNDFHFRTEDYDDRHDWARVGQCVRVDVGDQTPGPDRFDPTCQAHGWADGGLHDRVYYSARLYPLMHETLGHGTLVNNYRTSMDLSRPELGVASDLIVKDWGGVDFLMGNVTQARLLAGRAYLRPPNAFFGRNWDDTPDDFEIGFTWAGDLNAPLHMQTAFGEPILTHEGDVRYFRDDFHAIGVDAHYLYILNYVENSSRPMVGFFAFADYNRFMTVQDGDGLHGGVRMVVMKDRWDFRLGGEGRYVGHRYYPAIFDTDYTIRSQRFALTDDALSIPGVTTQTTLQEYLASRPLGHTWSYQAYMSLQVPLGSAEGGNTLPIVMYLEDTQGPANASAGLVVGPFRIGRVQLMGQALRRNFDGIRQLFGVDGSLLRARARWFLGSDSNPQSILNHFVLDARFDRRYFQTPQGSFAQTNDVEITFNYVSGG